MRILLRWATAFLFVFAAGFDPAAAQEAQPNREYFQTLDLPTINEYRSAFGKPGHAYWQQRADYEMDVTLDPDSRSFQGSKTITYANNSPQSVEYLWLQLDQNLFRPGNRGSEIQPPDPRWRGSFPGGDYTISSTSLCCTWIFRSPIPTAVTKRVAYPSRPSRSMIPLRRSSRRTPS